MDDAGDDDSATTRRGDDAGDDSAASERQRREIRREYRELMDKIDSTAEERGPCGSRRDEAIQQHMEQAGKLYEHVESTQETVLDAQTFKKLTNIVRNQAVDVSAQQSKFHATEYANNACATLGGGTNDDGRNRVPARDWARFGAQLPAKLAETGAGFRALPFRRVPCLQYLLGSFNESVEEKTMKMTDKVKRINTGARKQPGENTVIKAVRPGESPVNETDERVKFTLRQLQRACRKKKGKINYFEFVVNPKDFGATIENMFYVCFLLKDYQARLSFCPDTGLPLLEHISDTSSARVGAEGGGAGAAKDQMLLTITMDQWKEIIATLEIKDAMLKHPDNSKGDDGGGGDKRSRR